MSAMSDYLEQAFLNHFFCNTPTTAPSAWTVSLHTASLLDDGTGAEVTGGSYARQAATFGSLATEGGGGYEVTNAAQINYTNMPACTVISVGVRDPGGNVLYRGDLTASVQVGAGSTFTISANELKLRAR